jgi:integrase/recombinase XerD
VKTKFSKLITTTLFTFDERLLGIVLDWVKHLKTKGFGSQDPMFPRARIDQGKDNLSFESATQVEAGYWTGAGQIRKIFKKRSQQAGLAYFPPHTFRHLAISLAFKACQNGEQIKAISQNFGHEYIPTTLSTYANYQPSRLAEIIKEMDFSGKPEPTVKDEIRELKKLIMGGK